MKSKLLENIINYYIETIVDNTGCNEAEALIYLEDALQNEDVEYAIMETLN